MTNLTTPTPTPAATLGWDRASLSTAGAAELRDLYISPAVLQAEQARLFPRSWTLVASAEEVPAGAYLAVSAGPYPVALWRDGAGRCRAFHNLCRHRGLPLVEGRGTLGRYLVCPYHQWSFALDGRLVNVPQPDQFPDLDVEAMGLGAVEVAEWHGMIFVSVGAAAGEFDRAVAPLAGRLAEYLATDLVEVATSRYSVACNWKFLVENHIDVYHLWYLHQRSLRDYDHRSFLWEWAGRTWGSWEPLLDRSAAGPALPGLSEEHRVGIGAHLLFPNLMIINGPRYLATYDAQPLAPDRTEVTLRIRSLPGTGGDGLVRMVEGFLAEDIRACEQLQVGAGSPRFSIGALAAGHEAPLGCFHDLLRRELAG